MASAALRPVGHLVNHQGGIEGVQGVGYDYVLGASGVYVQSRSAHLVARILVSPCEVRGLAPVDEKVELPHGRIPARIFELGLRFLQAVPGSERFFAIRWDGETYRLAIPDQQGGAASLTYTPESGAVAEFHSHGRHSAFFSATDNADEQGFRIYGVVGQTGAVAPELNLRVGIYGHFAPVGFGQVFEGAGPNIRLAKEDNENKEIAYVPLGQRVPD